MVVMVDFVGNDLHMSNITVLKSFILSPSIVFTIRSTE